jgi:hypothetical protein
MLKQSQAPMAKNLKGEKTEQKSLTIYKINEVTNTYIVAVLLFRDELKPHTSGGYRTWTKQT